MENKKIFLGLDIGTDSVGYAVTDSNYNLLKKSGKPMWGAHTFDSAEQCAERRAFRTARRRLDRRQARVQLIRDLFAKQICEIDEKFFVRLKESQLYCEDTTEKNKLLFSGKGELNDKDYYKRYPTIHHLICEIIKGQAPQDVRLVYMACAWLVAHRGHFLSPVESDNMEDILKFDNVYNEFAEYCKENFKYDEFNENNIDLPWNVKAEDFAEVLKKKCGVSTKEKMFYELLFDGKKPKKTTDYPVDRISLIKLLSGGSVKPSALFLKNEEYNDLPSFSLDMPEDKAEEIYAALGDDADFIICLKNLYDWSIMSGYFLETKDSSDEYAYLISSKKVKDFDEHKSNLLKLKKFVKKYTDEQTYNEIFNISDETLKNYVAYSYHYKTTSKKYIIKLPKNKASKSEFYDFLKKKLSDITPDENDAEFYKEMMDKIENQRFLPKQVDGDNRVLPKQLYEYELKKILQKAASYLPFLSIKDQSGLSVADKIISVFNYRIPYYVGPINSNSENAWIVRKRAGRIYPWNFDELVDKDKSENQFIKRLLRNCTYLEGETSLPQNSLLYSKFCVLNAINNITVNGRNITVDCKKFIYNSVFKKYGNVTKKRIASALLSENYIEKDDLIAGIDETVGATLKPWISFNRLLTENILTEEEVERIIERIAYTEERSRIYAYLNKEFPALSQEDKRYISKLNLKNFGRLSKKLLSGIQGVNCETGETYTVIEALWETNCNLQQLLSDKFTFSKKIVCHNEEYYGKYPKTLTERMEDMYISNAVKRPIIRALEVVSDVKKALGRDPDRIFVEVTRGATEEQKNKRTLSRRKQLEEKILNSGSEDAADLYKELARYGDQELQNERLYLYFMQLGRCMYSENKIDIMKLATNMYDVDHIYPRSLVKDDSLSNKVLVEKNLNGQKSDTYPLPVSWQKDRYGFWKMLLDKDFISQEKFNRLTRREGFTSDEKMGFINRQLVETSQASKAMILLLKELVPGAEIVYVKAKLVSEFRHEVLDMVKCRSVNDYHHAKDAYLNIVVGNVYNGKFTKRWFNVDYDKYTLNPRSIFSNCIKNKDELIWEGASKIGDVRKTASGNIVHYTRYPYCKRGGLFDQLPIKAGEGNALYPRKKGLDVSKYGGYNSLKTACFTLVKCKTEKKDEVLIIAVDVMFYDRFLNDQSFADEYLKVKAEQLLKKTVLSVSYPLGRKIIKLQTMFSINGFCACIAGKDSGGERFKFNPCMNLILPEHWQQYINKLDKFIEKRKKKRDYLIHTEYDKISKENNLQLFDLLIEKTGQKPYDVFWGSVQEELMNKRDLFEKLTVEDQAVTLARIVELFKSSRASKCDLSSLGLKTSGLLRLNYNLSNWKKFEDVRIVDSSPSGIYETRSQNLLDLLK